MANSLAQDTDLDLLVVDNGSTVEINPTLTSGVKIADYVIDAVPGSLYAPEQSSYSAGTGIDITDNTISVVGDITPYSGGTGTTVTNHTINVTGDITPYSADTGISITNHKISVTGDITPYSGTSTINVSNHKISVNGDVTPYSAGVGIDINNHTISATGDITPYSGGTGITVSNHSIVATGDITPYSGGTGITVSSHKINVTGDITPYTQGTGISINNHQISVTGDITPYSGGTGIDVNGHTISATGDITPYSGGTGITVTNHTIAATGDITPYSAGNGISITNHSIAATGDITPYSGSEYIDITNHTVSVATPRKLVVDSTLYKTVNTATNEVHLGGNYVAGSGIDIVGHTISATGDITPYSAGSGISIASHKISVTGNIGGSLFEAVYGQTTYSDITAAIADKKIVYCRITPTGASRMAFLAYISNSNVEFQYYRSLSQHTSANQGDEVYVYTCNSNNNWTTTTRKTYTKIAAGTGLGVGYSNETLTISSNGSAKYATSAGTANSALSAGFATEATSATYISGPVVTGASITPTISSGTKIADYTINNNSGSLYAPSIQLTKNVFSNRIAAIEHQLTSTDISNKSFSENIDFSLYNTWVSTGIVTSVPIITIKIYTVQGTGAGSNLYWSVYNGGSIICDGMDLLTTVGSTSLRTIDLGSTLSNTGLILISNIGNAFTAGDVIYIDIFIDCVKLV